MDNRIAGFDPGTMFFQVAEKNTKEEIEIKSMRNAFVELDNYGVDNIEEILKQNKWQYVTDDKHFYILGEDSMRISQIFPNVVVRRPMQDGVLNKGEDKKILVVAKMIESLLGKAEKNSIVCFCTSSESTDNEVDDKFHKARIEGMLKRLGWNVKRIDEGLAVVLNERPTMKEPDGTEIPYTGLGISFGSGKVNAVLAYKGLPIVGWSATRSGDYIDKMVSENTNTPLSQITYIKENKLDFNNIDYNNDTIFCLDVYYTNVLEYCFRNFSKKFSSVKSTFSGPIDIVIAGGTASPPGFQQKAEGIIRELELPFQIKDIKISKDPRNSVVKGLLVQAHISYKKLLREELEKTIE